MRTTLAIDDVMLAAKALADQRRQSVGTVISDLARQTLKGSPAPRTRNGFPLLYRPDKSVVVTVEMVNALRDAEP